MFRSSIVFLAVIVILGVTVPMPVLADSNEFTLTVMPSLAIPTGPVLPGKLPLYSMGFGGSVRGDMIPSFAKFLFGRVSFDYEIVPLYGSKESVSFVYGGVALGAVYTPTPRFSLKASAGGGMYLAMAKAGTVRNPYVDGGAEAILRINPSMAVSAGARYKYNTIPDSVLYQGVSVQVGFMYDLAGSRRGTDIRFTPNLDPVFPLFYTRYDKTPLGFASFTNAESIALEKVKVEFYAKQYMDSPRICAEYASVKPGASMEVPVYGLFNDAIFRVTEGTKAAGEFRIEYYYLGRKTEKTVPVTVVVQNRNAMTWDDDKKAAAFVTAKDPAVLGFAKNIASMVRSDTGNPAISSEFRTALAIFQALKAYGVGYTIDPSTPFTELYGNSTAVDFLQFPGQTLSFRAGDCDDLSVLYAALLEAVGIETALVTTPGHIFVAFNSGLTKENAARIFSNKKDYIESEVDVWIPVEITLIRDGFLRAWSTGSLEWYAAVEEGTHGFFNIREAWDHYEPVGFAEAGVIAALPAQNTLLATYRSELDAFSRQQIAARVAELQGQINKGENADKAANKLGILYAQYGLLTEARKQFNFAIEKTNLVEAVINLGNVEFLAGNYEKAKALYERALKERPTSSAALVGLARALQALGDMTSFRNTVSRLQEADAPAYAANFPAGTASRASDAEQRKVNLWTE